MGRTWGTATAAVLLALAALPGPAAASWTKPFVLTDEHGVEPQVNVADDGEALVAWNHRGAGNASPGRGVAVAVRPPGATFGAPRQVSPDGVFWDGLAANRLGDAALGWLRGDYEGSFRPAGGEFGSAVPGPAKLSADTVMDMQGNLTRVFYTRFEVSSGDYRLAAATRSRDGGWGPVREVAAQRWIRDPAAAVDGAGNVTVAWSGDGGGGRQTFVAMAPPGGEFGPPRAISSFYDDSSGSVMPFVAVNPRGDTLVAWAVTLPPSSGGAGPQEVRAAFRPAGGEFLAEEALRAPAGSYPRVYRWDLALDRAGNAILAWSSAARAFHSYRPSAGRFAAAKPLPSYTPDPPLGSSTQLEPTVAFDATGDAVVAWVEGDPGPRSHLVAVRRERSSGRLGRVELVASFKNVFAPSLALDPQGNGVIAWSHEELFSNDSTRTEHAIRAALYDRRVPRIGAPTVTAGPGFVVRLSEPARVRAEFVRLGRRNRRVGAIAVRVGRGATTLTAEGKLARRLAQPGTYRVVVTARDAAGRRAKPRVLLFNHG
jgi:hypothetical protein